MTDTLFDLPAEAVVPPPPAERLSFGRRLTLRRKGMLAAGVHPLTRMPLLAADWQRRCGDCMHAYRIAGGRRDYWKCRRRGDSHGPATDLRISWPACELFTEEGRR